jgi:hypothetical protein
MDISLLFYIFVINHLKSAVKVQYLKTHSVPHSVTLRLGYKNQWVNAVYGQNITALQNLLIYIYIYKPSMLVPGNPGRLGTHIYVFTVESPQPVGAKPTSCTQLL